MVASNAAAAASRRDQRLGLSKMSTPEERAREIANKIFADQALTMNERKNLDHDSLALLGRLFPNRLPVNKSIHYQPFDWKHLYVTPNGKRYYNARALAEWFNISEKNTDPQTRQFFNINEVRTIRNRASNVPGARTRRAERPGWERPNEVRTIRNPFERPLWPWNNAPGDVHLFYGPGGHLHLRRVPRPVG